MSKWLTSLVFLGAFAVPAGVTHAADEPASDAAPGEKLELQTTSITGDSELPKVLVIVPWKSPELVEMTGRPLASLVEDALAPIDPEVFRRRLNYFKALKGAASARPDADGDNAAAAQD